MTRNPALDALMADYELGTEIGRGSFGVVWAARHRQLGRQVAVKELKTVDEADCARFRREARLLAGLRHPHVVTVHDFREAGDVRALVMEALTGGTLEDRGRSLSVEDVIVVGLAAASALHHVHRNGLLHRDLKPANVMFDAEGVVRVTDFGVAGGPASTLDRTAADQTMAGTLVGTPAFASPEQCGVALGAAWPSPSAASDQYALAATLYASLTGDVPHDTSGGILALCNRKMTQAARPVSQLRPGLPTAIALVLDRALERVPADRFGTVEDFAAALAGAATTAFGADWTTRSSVALKDPTLLASVGVTSSAHTADPSPSVAPPGSPDRPGGRRRIGRGGVAIAGVVLGAVIVGGVLLAGRLPSTTAIDATTTSTAASDPGLMPQRWTVATGASVFSSPTVTGSPSSRRVVVGSDDGSVYAIDATSGAIAWTAHTGAPVRSSPVALHDDAVVVGSDDGRVRSISIADGSTRWTAPMGFEVVSSPRVAGGVVLIGADHLYALDASTGARRWVAQESGPIVSSPAVTGDIAVVGSEDHAVYGIDVGTGAVRWRLQTGAPVQSSPVIAGDRAIVGGADGNLYSIESETGTLRWSVDLGAPIKSSPAVAGDVVVVGNDAGSVTARRLSDGSEVWQAHTSDRIDSSPRVVGNRIVVGGNDHGVHVLDRTTGTKVATFRTGGPVLSSPAEVDGDVVVGSYDRHVYRLGVP